MSNHLTGQSEFFERSEHSKNQEIRPNKRQKTTITPRSKKLLESPRKELSEKLDLEEKESKDVVEKLIGSQQTDLESSLPPVKTDQDAIEEYEAYSASQCTGGEGYDGANKKDNWIKGKSSIYVDAFNLALSTVLDEEGHLFNEAEMGLFDCWNQLNYETQYLYVRLFLRKTAAWHRINSLGYHSDVTDMDSTTKALQCLQHVPPSTIDNHAHPGEHDLPEEASLFPSFTFADRSEDEITTLEEALPLLRLDELRILAKDVKVQGKNKTELLRALRRTSQQQTGLYHVGLRRSESEASDSTEIKEGSDANRDGYFLKKILTQVGPCIRLSLAPLKLFERVHLVFYRSTEWTEKSLTTIILAKITRRNFPEYVVSRSANIFSSRSILLEYEASIRTQFRVDNILEFHGVPGRDGFEAVLEIFHEVYPRWQALLKDEQEKEDSVYISGEGAYLRRLSPAWVYTRIVHKTTSVYGKLKDHKREHELLTELLGQRLFHTSRRGTWYQRKALLEEHYMPALNPLETRNEESQKKYWRHIALRTCEDGLQDNLVHVTHHYDLQKRITKLERALRIPKRAQHDFTHVRLVAPIEVVIEGVRVEKEEAMSCHGNANRRGAKTIWLDPLENNGECSVEAMCLSHYRSKGWKGYHSEGGIVRTLFAYLFFDILFTYVPNVFQTPYQTCPLDLHTDAFFPSRLSEINHRLVQIGNGQAKDILRKVWDEHQKRDTCIVGLDWGFEIQDLIEIVTCFNGEALATICKVLAQEYGQRGGGIPDLFLWNNERTEVMFAEVKSENDRLSDTQRLWIHVLTGAGVRVELCNAVAKEIKIV